MRDARKRSKKEERRKTEKGEGGREGWRWNKRRGRLVKS